MLRHIIMLRWTPEATEDQKKAAEAGFRALPGAIAQIRGLACGPDLGLSTGAHDFAAVLDFDGADDWRVYQGHPAHRALVDGLIRPILDERASVQFDV
ncbi:Stress responsive A/B Barrel Domain [Thermomonospora echinospora]|uniref:Stress responsive A/B Barrel Domain n=1 Tax=Thermomonospora echinospora TaxID=1992 RepID=A0A1H5TA79_9ACTN|nr:Dabb family protein [Thermomonospora echinospora]SEF59782.1 Stress responsive A/B Barrel Domain [Thermomonospora echinospora]